MQVERSLASLNGNDAKFTCELSTRNKFSKLSNFLVLGSTCMGTKNNNCLFFDFKGKDIKEVRKICRFLIDNYTLPDFYIFRNIDGLCGICLKTVQKNQYAKILRKAEDYKLLSKLLKYEYTFLRLPLEFVRVVKSKYHSRNISLGHYNYIKNKTGKIKDYDNFSGRDEVNLIGFKVKGE